MKKENRALKSAPASIQESVVAPSRKKHRSSLLGTIIRRSLLVFFSVIIMLFSALLLVLNLVFNGPSPTARNQLTMTLIEASATKWVPALFIGEDAVADIRTSIVDAELKDDVTDVNTVIINRGNMISGTDEWADYPDGIRIEPVAGDTYNAHVMIVRDPAQVYLGISTQTGFSTNTPGKRITAAIEDEGAIAAINAGAFNDDGTAGSHVGSIPEGLVYSQGNCVWKTGAPPNGITGFAGFNEDNVLIVHKENISQAQAEKLNIRDGCCFGPVLIMNSEINMEAYNNIAGLNPRTAIGQREDGAVFFVCIDGRQPSSKGGEYADIIDIKKYIVRQGKEKIAAFTLVDQNHAESKTEIPDWGLGTLTFFFTREESYRVQKLDGHTVYVNNVPLDSSATIQISTTRAEDYLPEGIAGVRVCTQEISGLVAAPSVRIVDGNGNEMAVNYDDATHTFVEQTTADTISDAERDIAINAIKTYALYMIKQAGQADVAKYFLRGSDAYKSITDTELSFVQDAASHDFTNETVKDYCRYTDDLFSVRVSVTLNQHRASGSVKESVIDQSLFFEKQSSGKWLCYEMTAVDVSKPVEQVRLTFQNGDTMLESNFYDADSTQITCPVVSAPEGKSFSGWMTEEKNESGNPVMNLVFQPDENGNAILPSGTTLQPMTLLPLFE